MRFFNSLAVCQISGVYYTLANPSAEYHFAKGEQFPLIKGGSRWFLRKAL